MKEEQDYIRDIAAMRSLMERSTKFLSLSGLAGILAGIYALSGAFISYQWLGFSDLAFENMPVLPLVGLAISVLVLAVGTAVLLSRKKALKMGEKFWNPVTQRLLMHMAVPLVAGGLLMLIMLDRGWMEMLAPVSLLFYGLALFGASKFTYTEVRSLGLMQVALGLLGAWLPAYGLLCWAIGFGILHIVYGIYMHHRYEK